MKIPKIFQHNLTAKIPFIGGLIITTFIIFFTETKSTLANDSFPKVLVREDKPLTPTEEISDEQFSTDASDLLANPHNEQLNIDFSRYVYLEIGERGCDVASYLAISAGIGASYSVSFPNTPANTITISGNTPTRGRQTVKLESEEGATPESQKACDEVINKTIEIDRKLRILQMHELVQYSELELTIQNSWDILKQQNQSIKMIQ